MSTVNTEIQYSLTLNTATAQRDIMKLEASFMRILSYINMLTPGNTAISKVITMAQSAITTMRTLQLAIRAVQLASGPVGWLYAATTIGAAAFSGYGMYESMTGAS